LRFRLLPALRLARQSSVALRDKEQRTPRWCARIGASGFGGVVPRADWTHNPLTGKAAR
jgi:hypothetical protein